MLDQIGLIESGDARQAGASVLHADEVTKFLVCCNKYPGSSTLGTYHIEKVPSRLQAAYSMLCCRNRCSYERYGVATIMACTNEKIW